MKTKCGACGRQLESGETIDVAGQGPRCYSCLNHETADRLGIEFDEPQFQLIVLEARVKDTIEVLGDWD